jgi:short-subunit dehydrogenase
MCALRASEGGAETDAAKRWAIVTGASSGLGVEFARQLARRRYSVVLVARRRDRLESLARELAEQGSMARVIERDLAAPGSAQRLVRDVEGLGISPSLLVNNAGVGMYGGVFEHAPERIESLLRLNIVTLTELALLLGRQMAQRGSGAIINVSSTASLQPDPWVAVYGASKAYVTSFSLALGEELAPLGVHVLTFCPGLTRTEFDAVAGTRAAHAADWMYMSADECVAFALRALDRRRRFVVAGWMNRVAAVAVRYAPLRFVTRVNARLLAPRPLTARPEEEPVRGTRRPEGPPPGAGGS